MTAGRDIHFVECGEIPTETHHVVPRALGGTFTVRLCEQCHKLVHGSGQPLSHGQLGMGRQFRLQVESPFEIASPRELDERFWKMFEEASR